MNKKIISIFVALAFILIQLPTFAASSTPSIYIDNTNTPSESKITKGTICDLPIKIESLTSSSEIFSFLLKINFDKTGLKAKSIKGNVGEGIEVLKELDNDKGYIEFWYSLNGNLPTDNILATVSFEYLGGNFNKVDIDKESEFYKIDKTKTTVNYLNIHRKRSIVSIPPVPKPVFNNEKSTVTFTSKHTVKFAQRTDDAKIYYTTSENNDNPDENDNIYRKEDGITINDSKTITAVALLDGVYSDCSSKTYKRVNMQGGGNGPSGTSKNPLVIAQPTVTPAPTPATSKKEFSDISSHWSKGFIEKLVAKGIINGYEDGTVRPDNKITRAEAAKIIISALGIQPAQSTDLPFADSLAIGDWAKGYIQKAVDMGIMTGYEDNTFKPAQNVSRKELVVIAARAFALAGDSAEELSFDDKDSIPDWAKQSVAAALKLNIISGFEDNTFKPDNFVTRGESSKIISSCMDLKK